MGGYKTMSKISEEIYNQMQWMETILSNIGDGVVLADSDGMVLLVNIAIKKILEKEDKDIINRNFNNIIEELREKLNKDDERDEINTQVCINTFVNEVKNSSNEVIGKVIIVPNVAECDRAHQIIHRMAHYDSLTGLPNRALINENLEKVITEAKEANQKVGVAFIDLDNFKSINDTKGHDVGDSVLRKATRKIEGFIDDNDFAGRLGGDEFIIIMKEAKYENLLYEKMNKLIAEIDKPAYINNKEFHISASIGISIFPEHGEDAKTLMRNADIAMYKAKALGKNTCQIFNTDMIKI
jgi:polar amino acid transport system substrate-binding protein